VGCIKPGDIYDGHDTSPKSAAADVNLQGPEIPPGRVVRIVTFIALDLTTANKTIRLGYKRGGDTFWVKREGAGASGYGIGLGVDLLLVEGESPVARIESATANDECDLTVRGIYL